MLRSGCSQNGFTLIELIVAMAIAGIVLAIAVFSAKDSMKSYQLKGAARQIYSDMQLIRLKAIKEGREWAMEFSGNKYALKSSGADDSWDSWDSDDDKFIKIVDLTGEYSGITITQAPTRNVFSPNGTVGPMGTSSCTVKLSGNGKTKELKTNTSTGNVRIE